MCAHPDGIPLSGGTFSSAVRRGDLVERAASAPNVRLLLEHLQRRGFRYAPSHFGTTEDGEREQLALIPGVTGSYPLSEPIRSERALVSVARAVRALHDAAGDFTPPDPHGWGLPHEHLAPSAPDTVGHLDIAPWNIVFQRGEVAAFVDWDTAGPTTRAWDLAYAACRFVPLCSPRHARLFGWPEPPDAAARLRLFAREYGTDPAVDPADLLDLAAVRLSGHAARIEREVRAGNPAFEHHRRERHAEGYREDAAHLLTHRAQYLAG